MSWIQAIRDREAKATPGESALGGAWGHATGADGCWRIVLKHRPLIVLDPEHPISREDATFIANARRDIPMLLAEVERLSGRQEP